jgi:NADH-quinone oxidoreductase subunit I
MYGMGLIKGMGVTMRHFLNTYVDDVRYGFRKYSPKTAENFAVRQGTEAKGAFTVQYPEEKMPVPERFRFVPFLVVEDYDHPERPGKFWCTACGICAKVCPPQCIWIVRDQDAQTGKPIPQPDEFYIDIDLCMNCGFCAEFCPFDAIKMDHDYELASYDRTSNHIYDMPRLAKEFRYWKTIAPTRAVEEAEARGGWEHKDIQKEMRRGGGQPKSQAVEPQVTTAQVQVESAVAAEAAPPAPAKAQPDAAKGPVLGDEEERRRRREEALARKAARSQSRKDAE